ncbi:MAG: Zn-dependent amino-or carboxypeptidase family, partial [Mucilaginibacter sp.]|nr:Zn-dependent amino-or carboxypeptidase family [Mucilaginibacter sp.]
MIRIGKTLLFISFISLVRTGFAQQIKVSPGVEQALNKVDTA